MSSAMGVIKTDDNTNYIVSLKCGQGDITGTLNMVFTG